MDTRGHRFQENMEIESPGLALFRKVDHIHLLQPTTNQDSTLVVAKGTTDHVPVTSLLTHGNESMSFLSEFYNYVCVNKNIPATATTIFLQTKTNQRKTKTTKKGSVYFFLGGWLQPNMILKES